MNLSSALAEIYHYFLFFFSFFILKGVLDFWLTTSAGNREVWKTSQRRIRPLIGSIGEYRARFPGVDRYHVASRRMRNRRLYLDKRLILFFLVSFMNSYLSVIDLTECCTL